MRQPILYDCELDYLYIYHGLSELDCTFVIGYNQIVFLSLVYRNWSEECIYSLTSPDLRMQLLFDKIAGLSRSIDVPILSSISSNESTISESFLVLVPLQLRVFTLG